MLRDCLMWDYESLGTDWHEEFLIQRKLWALLQSPCLGIWESHKGEFNLEGSWGCLQPFCLISGMPRVGGKHRPTTCKCRTTTQPTGFVPAEVMPTLHPNSLFLFYPCPKEKSLLQRVTVIKLIWPQNKYNPVLCVCKVMLQIFQ